MKVLHLIALGMFCLTGRHAMAQDTLSYHIEATGTAGGGNYAPLWFTADRHGMASVEPNSAYLEAGIKYHKKMKHHWQMGGGLDLAGGYNLLQKITVQQFYADFSWRCLNLSLGMKERNPLGKDLYLSSGAMVEEGNARPIPQVRLEIADYVNVPGTKGWLGFKGHFAYGRFMDDNWVEDRAIPNHQTYVTDIFYHTKSAMFRIGNREKRPWEFEIGLLVSSQFGGEQHTWNEKTAQWDVHKMSHNFKDFLTAIIPTKGSKDDPFGDQVNVSGNFIGSWNAAFTYYLKDWKLRAYYEHLFEDESQMFMQYGRWKDGHLGIEVTMPQNPWISKVLWEGLATKDQSGPILYDGFLGSFDQQISAADNYYNNYFYQGWQHWGMGIGNPLLPGPIYNQDGSLMFRSNRVKSNHFALCGNPTEEWAWRMKLTEVRHWGTYGNPLDEKMHQFSSLYEVTYKPILLKGWSFTAALGLDRGDFLGDNTSGMITIKKEGILWKR